MNFSKPQMYWFVASKPFVLASWTPLHLMLCGRSAAWHAAAFEKEVPSCHGYIWRMGEMSEVGIITQPESRWGVVVPCSMERCCLMGSPRCGKMWKLKPEDALQSRWEVNSKLVILVNIWRDCGKYLGNKLEPDYLNDISGLKSSQLNWFNLLGLACLPTRRSLAGRKLSKAFSATHGAAGWNKMQSSKDVSHYSYKK